MIWQESWTPKWHMLSEKYTGGGGCLETMAASCEQGVGFIVRWRRESIHDPFVIDAMDTVGCTWIALSDFTLAYVPEEPPANLQY